MKQYNILLSIIVFAILTRVAIPPFFGHLANFSALDALALFCGAYCERRISAIVICVASVWMSDVLLTQTLFYDGFYWQYGCYALITLLGGVQRHSHGRENLLGDPRFRGDDSLCRNDSLCRDDSLCREDSKIQRHSHASGNLPGNDSYTGMTIVAGMALASAILFFVVTNFGVWVSTTLYPHTIYGLIACYVAAIPFFKYTLVSDMLFSGVFFSAYFLVFKSSRDVAIKKTYRI